MWCRIFSSALFSQTLFQGNISLAVYRCNRWAHFCISVWIKFLRQFASCWSIWPAQCPTRIKDCFCTRSTMPFFRIDHRESCVEKPQNDKLEENVFANAAVGGCSLLSPILFFSTLSSIFFHSFQITAGNASCWFSDCPPSAIEFTADGNYFLIHSAATFRSIEFLWGVSSR